MKKRDLADDYIEKRSKKIKFPDNDIKAEIFQVDINKDFIVSLFRTFKNIDILLFQSKNENFELDWESFVSFYNSNFEDQLDESKLDVICNIMPQSYSFFWKYQNYNNNESDLKKLFIQPYLENNSNFSLSQLMENRKQGLSENLNEFLLKIEDNYEKVSFKKIVDLYKSQPDDNSAFSPSKKTHQPSSPLKERISKHFDITGEIMKEVNSQPHEPDFNAKIEFSLEDLRERTKLREDNLIKNVEEKLGALKRQEQIDSRKSLILKLADALRSLGVVKNRRKFIRHDCVKLFSKEMKLGKSIVSEIFNEIEAIAPEYLSTLPSDANSPEIIVLNIDIPYSKVRKKLV